MKERLSRFLNESRQRTARFMTGRNGNDALNRFLLVCDLVLLLLSSLLRGPFFLLIGMSSGVSYALIRAFSTGA